MKVHALIGALLALITSCSSPQIALTPFANDVIGLFETTAGINGEDRIIMMSGRDSTSSYLVIWSDNGIKPGSYDDYRGNVAIGRHKVLLFGDGEPMFWSGGERCMKRKKGGTPFLFYDPAEWVLCFNDDQSFDKMHSYKVSPNNGIADICAIVDKYYSIGHVNKEEVFPYYDVEQQAVPVSGQDLSFLESVHDRMDVILGVDEEGCASLLRIDSAADENVVGNYASVIDSICRIRFIPAMHRGETVRSTYRFVLGNPES